MFSGNAQLINYRRRFNKASVRNWGTKSIPGPTLNVERDETSSCPGVAFEFPEHEKEPILQYLQKREGKAFHSEEHDIDLDDGRTVQAIVPMYQGKSILDRSIEELAGLAVQAEGTSGRGGHELCAHVAPQKVDINYMPTHILINTHG